MNASFSSVLSPIIQGERDRPGRYSQRLAEWLHERPFPSAFSQNILGPILLAALLAGCATAPPATQPTTLKDAFQKDFKIGVAINERQFRRIDTNGVALITNQFDSISPENILKWESVHPQPDTYAWDGPDKYVEFGEQNHMLIVGHTLVWHSQVPRWVFQDADGKPLKRDALLKRMHDHIQTVVGRYKGRIKVWDVVNEALNDNGTLRQSPWFKIIGEDYIAKAFEYAHEADPDAILRYNDYSMENEPKRKGAIALIKKLQAENVPVTAIGMQDHANLIWPTPELEDATITAFANLGLRVMITELDVDASRGGQRNQSADVAQNSTPTNIGTQSGGPFSDAAQQQLAQRYADLFKVFLKHRKDIDLVTFWGVTDADSWRRRGNPLLFDGNWQPKPAFAAVLKTATGN
jgi:endo-1,4-beta-xylanase